MRIDTALLCEAATVQEGLLNVLGGGVTIAGRGDFPAPLGLMLAIRVLVHPTEMDQPHRLEVQLLDEDGEKATEFFVEFNVERPEDFPPGEEASLAIPWNFPKQPAIPHPGRYSFELLIDGIHQGSVPFRAVKVDSEGETGDE